VADLAIYAREHEPSLSLDLDECVALPNISRHERHSASRRRRRGRRRVLVAEGGRVTWRLDHSRADVVQPPTPAGRPPHPSHRRCAPLFLFVGLILGLINDYGSPTGYETLELEDYLCTCLYCPRAVAIQRAYQLYGFALDHPQSEALLRVLRACANYDETVVDIDPLLVLHAEKLLEELQMHENEAFRLLAASHFQRRI
jgi:hypothetical protein